MGRQAELKVIRNQIRNVAKEKVLQVIQDESVQEISKRLDQLIGAKLDAISANVDKELKNIEGQTQTFRGMIYRDIQLSLSRELSNIALTMAAWQATILEELNIPDIGGFEARVATKKAELQKELEAEAKAQQEAAEAKAIEDAKANKKALEDKIAADRATEATKQSDAEPNFTGASTETPATES